MLLRTDPLGDETLKKVGDLLLRDGKKLRSSEAPRQPLESLFLEIVERARTERRATSGAVVGGRIADFLLTPGRKRSERSMDGE